MNQSQLDSIYEGFHDDETFARESLSVLDKQGQLRVMEFGPAQKKLAAIVKRQRELKKPVRVIVLKARQVWVSTYVASRFWRDTTHRSGQHTLVIAQDLKTASNIFDYYDRFHTNYRPFRGVIGIPELTSDRKDSLEYANGSWIKIHTASNVNVGRSFTLRRVHFSESAFYGDQARALRASVMSAVPDDADTEVIDESTANGVGNEFHIMWNRAVAGESEWIPFFFAWWEHPEYTRPLDQAPEVFQRSLTEAEWQLKTQHSATLEQLNWRRWKIQNDLNGDEGLFDQEFPHSPEVAFLASGRPRFDLKAVARMPIVRDALEGGLEMLEQGGYKKLIFLPRERGELTLYRKPQEGRHYMVGADVAEGIDVNEGKGQADPDYSVAQVLDRDTGEQVARFRARVQPSVFGESDLFHLLLYYNWAQLVPEANGPGLAAIDALLRKQYPASFIYHRVRVTDQDPQERADLIGFRTTAVTRPQLISLLDGAIREMSILVHDPITAQELRTFVIKPSGKAEHAYGQHDDTCIALGLAVTGIVQMPRKPDQKLRPDTHKKLNNYLHKNDRQEERGERFKLL